MLLSSACCAQLWVTALLQLCAPYFDTCLLTSCVAAGAVHDSSAYDTAPVGTVTGLDSGYDNRQTVNQNRGYVGNTPAGGTPVLHTDRV